MKVMTEAAGVVLLSWIHPAVERSVAVKGGVHGSLKSNQFPVAGDYPDFNEFGLQCASQMSHDPPCS